MHYHHEFKPDLEVKPSLMDYLTRMMKDEDGPTIIDVQIDDFKKSSKYFGCSLIGMTLNLKTPTDWWESYRDKHPKLKKFVDHVLCLKCSSFGY